MLISFLYTGWVIYLCKIIIVSCKLQKRLQGTRFIKLNIPATFLRIYHGLLYDIRLVLSTPFFSGHLLVVAWFSGALWGGDALRGSRP